MTSLFILQHLKNHQESQNLSQKIHDDAGQDFYVDTEEIWVRGFGLTMNFWGIETKQNKALELLNKS